MPSPRTKEQLENLLAKISDKKNKKKEKKEKKKTKVLEKKKTIQKEKKEKTRVRAKVKKEKKLEKLKEKKLVEKRIKKFIFRGPRHRFHSMDLRYLKRKANNKRRYDAISDMCNSVKAQYESNGGIFRPVFPYLVVIACNEVILNRDRLFSTKEKAMSRLNDLYDSSELNIEFPVLYTRPENRGGIVESNFEYLILEDSKITNNKDIFVARNEVGKFVEHETNDENWSVVYVKPFNVEETFTVLFKDKVKRNYQTFIDIYEDLVMDDCYNNLNMKRLMVLDNKLLIQFDDDRDYVTVLCKCIEDSTRLYNVIKERTIKDKIKTIIFFGFVAESLKGDCLKKLSSHTGVKLDKLKAVTHFPQNR